MKSALSVCIISGFVATYCLLVCSSPITGRSESALVVRASGEVAEFFDQHELVKRLSATVFTGTLALLGVFAGGACAAAWMAAGLNVPADIGCFIFATASLAYASFAHFQKMTPPRSLEAVDWANDGFLGYIHLYPPSEEHGRPLDQLQSAYNGSERILVIHHPCSTPGCYNVFYDNHYDVEGDLVHHLALEPRGDWHIQKRQQETGPERNKYTGQTTDKGTPLFGDYDFYDFTKSVEKTFGKEKNANAFEIDFLKGTYNNKKDVHHAGYFCMNWATQNSGVAGTKGVFWQSEKTHMADPDALPARENRCKTFTDS